MPCVGVAFLSQKENESRTQNADHSKPGAHQNKAARIRLGGDSAFQMGDDPLAASPSCLCRCRCFAPLCLLSVEWRLPVSAAFTTSPARCSRCCLPPKDEQLLFAAKTDSSELLESIFANEGTYDVNFQDGLGNTGTLVLLHSPAGRHATWGKRARRGRSTAREHWTGCGGARRASNPAR